jgi:hypothetical protein
MGAYHLQPVHTQSKHAVRCLMACADSEAGDMQTWKSAPRPEDRIAAWAKSFCHTACLEGQLWPLLHESCPRVWSLRGWAKATVPIKPLFAAAVRHAQESLRIGAAAARSADPPHL